VEAANHGKITRIDFVGKNDTYHADVVQLQIEGGFNAGNCNTQFAAILKDDNHLISFALAAYMAKENVNVQLSQTVSYYPGRCTISSIFSDVKTY